MARHLWDEIFEGYCNGAQLARELHGVEVRLNPDITRSAPLEDALTLVAPRGPLPRARGRRRRAGRRGGATTRTARSRPRSGRPARRASGSVPHAGEVVGPESVASALDELEPDRIRHGFRAIEDPALVEELADRGLVLDVTPVSNVRTGAVASLEEHPLPELVGAGVRCSVSTDDPVMFDTDLPASTRRPRRSGSIRGRCTRPRSPARSATRRPGRGSARSARRTTGSRRAANDARLFSGHGTCCGKTPAPCASPRHGPEAQGLGRAALRGHAVLQQAAHACQVGVRAADRRLRRRLRLPRRRLRRARTSSTSSTASAAAAAARRSTSR